MHNSEEYSVLGPAVYVFPNSNCIPLLKETVVKVKAWQLLDKGSMSRWQAGFATRYREEHIAQATGSLQSES